MNFLIPFGIYSIPKLSKSVRLSPFTYKDIQLVSIDLYSSRLIAHTPFFILVNFFLNKRL